MKKNVLGGAGFIGSCGLGKTVRCNFDNRHRWQRVLDGSFRLDRLDPARYVP